MKLFDSELKGHGSFVGARGERRGGIRKSLRKTNRGCALAAHWLE